VLSIAEMWSASRRVPESERVGRQPESDAEATGWTDVVMVGRDERDENEEADCVQSDHDCAHPGDGTPFARGEGSADALKAW